MAQNQTHENTNQKVKLSILNFINSKNNANYSYLSVSIGNALRENFKKTFKYQKTQNRKIERRLKEILAKKKRKRYQMTKKDVEILAEKEKLDIIIYGKYTPYKKSYIKINTKIYFSHNNKHFSLDKRSLPISTYIFVVIDEITKSAIEKVELVFNESQLPEKTDAKILSKKDKKTILLVRSKKISKSKKKRKERKREIQKIKNILLDKYQYNILFLEDYLDENKNISPPKEIKKTSSLKKWSNKYDIQNLMRIQFKSKEVAFLLIRNSEETKRFSYRIKSVLKKKKKELKRIPQFFKKKIKQKITLERTDIQSLEKTFEKLKEKEKEEREEEAEESEQSSPYLQDHLVELGGGVFYPITFFNFSIGENLVLGTGFNMYLRAPLNSIVSLLPQKEKINLPGWLKYNALMGFTFSSIYSFDFDSTNRFGILDVPEGQNVDYLFQNYIFSFEFSYLYLIENSIRLGLVLKPSYYFGIISYRGSDSSLDFTEGLNYQNFVLPIIVELNYAFSKHFSWNISFANYFYDIASSEC